MRFPSEIKMLHYCVCKILLRSVALFLNDTSRQFRKCSFDKIVLSSRKILPANQRLEGRPAGRTYFVPWALTYHIKKIKLLKILIGTPFPKKKNTFLHLNSGLYRTVFVNCSKRLHRRLLTIVKKNIKFFISHFVVRKTQICHWNLNCWPQSYRCVLNYQNTAALFMALILFSH